MPIQKIKSGRILSPDLTNYVGNKGQLFFDEDVGELRLSDGITPGGISVGSGGTGLRGPTGPAGPQGPQGNTGPTGPSGTGAALEVSLIQGTTASSTVTNITAIRFDTDSGFDLTDLGSGAVRVGMNSTFKYWEVEGQSTLVAEGLDTVKISAGPGIILTTSVDPKQLEISAASRTTTLYQDGALSLTIGTVRWYASDNIIISKITARLAEAADRAVTFNVKKSGEFTQTVSISTGSVKVISTTSISMISDDYLTVDVTSVGDQLLGSGLSIEFTYNLE